jgi:hypothetical protein
MGTGEDECREMQAAVSNVARDAMSFRSMVTSCVSPLSSTHELVCEVDQLAYWKTGCTRATCKRVYMLKLVEAFPDSGSRTRQFYDLHNKW